MARMNAPRVATRFNAGLAPCLGGLLLGLAVAHDAACAETAEPQVQRIVTEDSGVRIEELRVRGQTQRIVVRSKLPGVPAYQIGTAADGRDVTQDRRSEGRSLWQLFSF